ncbi:aldo/keto reductase [Oscillospiraceae bacterium MB08-C2-2]|nr:aldo/keto reductase [Oscillospiraceae bacterium MB08-C2-2]
MALSFQDRITLNNGVQMPQLGFGTYQIAPADAPDAVAAALEIGYRHLDCAAAYQNEEAVGAGIRKSGVDRSELFITSKVWVTDMGYEDTLKAFARTTGQLGTDYLDLYIIHWPKPNSGECFRALEQLYQDKKVRAIGVSNFKPHHFEMLADCKITPVVNQIEYHPILPQDETQSYCESRGIVITAHSPFMEGRIRNLPLIGELAKKYGKTPAQIALRWILQRGVIAIPKSITPQRMKENTQLYDFQLSAADMERIAALETGERSAPDPDNMPF